MNFQRVAVACLGTLVLYVAISGTTAHFNGEWRCAHDDTVAKADVSVSMGNVD